MIIPFTKSLAELSFKVNPNPNDGNLTGLMNCQRVVDTETGSRQHSGVTYLHRTTGRQNISVLVGAHATKVLFSDPNGDLVATGVEFDVAGVRHVVNANKEVIISAGKSLKIHAPLISTLLNIFQVRIRHLNFSSSPASAKNQS